MSTNKLVQQAKQKYSKKLKISQNKMGLAFFQYISTEVVVMLHY
jgi:hypothetical protein